MGYFSPDADPAEGAKARLAEAATTPRARLQKVLSATATPRFGYRTRSLGISDIMNVDEILAEPRVNYGGTPAGIESSSRNSQGT